MPSIRDFSGGVLNQELQNRDTGAGVLFDCKNVLSSWNGELRKRTGTKWLKSLEGNSKIIPYRLPDGNDMIMMLKDKVIKCYKFDEDDAFVPVIYTTGSTNVPFPTSSWSSNTNGNWTVKGNSSYTNNAYLAVNTSNSYVYSQSDFNSSKTLYFQFKNTTPVVFTGCSIYWLIQNVQNGYAHMFGVDPVIQYSDDEINWVSVRTQYDSPSYNSWRSGSYGVFYFYTECRYNVNNIDPSILPHTYWRIVFTQKDISGSLYDTTANRQPRIGLSNIKFESGGTETELVFNNCPYENEDFDNIRWSQNNQTLTMACKGKQPYQIKLSSGSFSDSLFAPSDYTTLWTAMGMPSCVTYYQNRLWFGGFDLYPTRVYASEFNTDASTFTGFDKFTIPTPIVATSPIMADGTEISSTIENMWGGNNALYCLSADGISMIDAQGAIVATNQVEFKLRNREPVNSMVPTVKDDIMIYLGRDKRKILITDYDFVVQRFKANCISDNYNNFFQSGIRELHYIPRRSSLIYGTLEDGKWFALLFDIDKGKNALYPFESTGRVIDVQPIKYGDETKLIILTQLPSYQYILEEKFPQDDQKIMDFMSTQEKQDYTKDVINSQQAYLDHSIKLAFETPTTIIDNLPYLKDEEIEVIADGQYLGTKTVLADTDTGVTYVELDEPVSEVVMGYKYDSYAVLKFVTPYTERKFPKEIAVNFINTGYLEVGNTFDSLKSVLNNLVESVNISNKRILMNGNYAKTLDKHSFETPYVIVRSDKGMPFIITGMDYRVDLSNYQGGV